MPEAAVLDHRLPLDDPARPGAARRVLRIALIATSVLSWLLAALAFLLRPQILAYAAAQPLGKAATPETRLADLAQLAGGLSALAIYLAVGGLLLLAALLVLRGPRREWERLIEMVLGYRRHLRLMLLGSFVLVVSQLALPLTIKYLLDDVVNKRHDVLLTTLVIALLMLMLLVRLFSGAMRLYHSQAMSYSISASLRERLYAHLQSLSYSFFDRARQGELMSRATNDVERLQLFMLNTSEDFFVAPLMVYGGVACVFYLNWQLALVVLGCAPVLAILLRISSQRLRLVNREAQAYMGHLTAELAEGINTIRLAQSFGLEGTEFDRFRQASRNALGKLHTHARITSQLLPWLEFVGFLGPVAIIAALCYQAVLSAQPIALGELVAIAGIGGMVANPLGKLSRVVVTVSIAEACSQRIHAVLETVREISDRPGARDLTQVDSQLCFDNVSLRYGPKDPLVLDRVSFTIRPGQVVAFVGESGSGKSSIINLVPRFYDPTGGRILLDGCDVRDLTLKSLRGHIGIVSQETILVHGTVRENIAYGSPQADVKDILDAALSANAHNFIMEFTEGYETLVGERGVTLSGGQRQRIAIARALLRDPRILLLDEATSALDSVSEAVVQDALNKLMYGRTTLMVAHRLSTVRGADLIIVLRQGRIVETGRHEELLTRSGGEYARLVKLQGL